MAVLLLERFRRPGARALRDGWGPTVRERGILAARREFVNPRCRAPREDEKEATNRTNNGANNRHGRS